MKPLKYVAPVFMFKNNSPKWYQKFIVYTNLILNSILPIWFLKWNDPRPKNSS